MINEAVYWFTQQEYPADRRELLIVNDAVNQTLVSDVPGVRILNMKVRSLSLGFKMNIAIGWARGSICLVWEDDDVSLPHRIQQSVDALGAAYEYFEPDGRFFHVKGSAPVIDKKNCKHHASAYRTASFRNKYQRVTKGHDSQASGFATNRLKCCPKELTELKDNEYAYVYRWGVSAKHLSGITAVSTDEAYTSFDPGPDGTYKVEAVRGDFDYAKLRGW